MTVEVALAQWPGAEPVEGSLEVRGIPETDADTLRPDVIRSSSARSGDSLEIPFFEQVSAIWGDGVHHGHLNEQPPAETAITVSA